MRNSLNPLYFTHFIIPIFTGPRTWGISRFQTSVEPLFEGVNRGICRNYISRKIVPGSSATPNEAVPEVLGSWRVFL